MASPLGLLAIGSIFVGFLTKEMFVGLGGSILVDSIYIDKSHVTFFDSEFLPIEAKLVPVIFSLIGAFLSVLFY